MRVDPSAERFLMALESIDRRVERAQRQIASGKKFASASDGPDEIGVILAAHARLEATAQVRANLNRAKAEVDTAESAIAKSVQILERMNELGVRGVTETQTPEMRLTIATEAGILIEQLITLASTSVEDRFIFSGDNDDLPPFRPDGASPTGYVYQGSATATRQMLHPAGSRFAVSRTAEQIFDDPAASVLAAAVGIRTALENVPSAPPDDPAYQAQYDAQTDAIDLALTGLRKAQDHIATQHSFYGVVQKRVNEAIDFSYELELRQRTELSSLEDADLAESALELTQAGAHKEIALSARARQPNRSLFEYLG